MNTNNLTKIQKIAIQQIKDGTQLTDAAGVRITAGTLKALTARGLIKWDASVGNYGRYVLVESPMIAAYIASDWIAIV